MRRNESVVASEGLLELVTCARTSQPPSECASRQRTPVLGPVSSPSTLSSPLQSPLTLSREELIMLGEDFELSPSQLHNCPELLDDLEQLPPALAQSDTGSDRSREWHEEERTTSLLHQNPRRFERAIVLSHKRWQNSLRVSLAGADGYTRTLIWSATKLDPCGTVGVVSHLSPRQVASLHPPTRVLVQGLLDRIAKGSLGGLSINARVCIEL